MPFVPFALLGFVDQSARNDPLVVSSVDPICSNGAATPCSENGVLCGNAATSALCPVLRESNVPSCLWLTCKLHHRDGTVCHTGPTRVVFVDVALSAEQANATPP